MNHAGIRVHDCGADLCERPTVRLTLHGRVFSFPPPSNLTFRSTRYFGLAQIYAARDSPLHPVGLRRPCRSWTGTADGRRQLSEKCQPLDQLSLPHQDLYMTWVCGRVRAPRP